MNRFKIYIRKYGVFDRIASFKNHGDVFSFLRKNRIILSDGRQMPCVSYKYAIEDKIADPNSLISTDEFIEEYFSCK